MVNFMTFLKLPKVKISLSYLFILVVNLLTDNFLLFVIMSLVFIFHELGHVFLIFFKKGTIENIELNAFGATITTNLEKDLLVDFGRHLYKCNHLSNLLFSF